MYILYINLFIAEGGWISVEIVVRSNSNIYIILHPKFPLFGNNPSLDNKQAPEPEPEPEPIISEEQKKI